MDEAQMAVDELIEGLDFLSREELIEMLTSYIVLAENLERALDLLEKHLVELEARDKKIAELNELSTLISAKREKLTEGMIEYAKKKISAASSRAKTAAAALHNKPGGSRDKRNAIVEIWQSGKYSSRDLCAEQECAALGMSFSTARKALRGVHKREKSPNSP